MSKSCSNPRQYLAQAFLLMIRHQLPADEIINLSWVICEELGFEHTLSLLIAAYVLIITQTTHHDSKNKEGIAQLTEALLVQCLSAREIDTEKIPDWFTADRLNDQAYVLRAMVQGLVEIIDEWIFDPHEFIFQN